MPYADLVLEGGGVKGIALVGAISVLEERGYLFKRIAGTSAGSVVGALVAADYKADELQRIMREVDYLKFQDAGLSERLLVGKIAALLTRSGVYRGDYLREWLGGLLEKQNRSTFADLPYQDDMRQLPAEQQYRLVVMTSDLSAGCLRRLPWEYDRYGVDRPTQKVADAVRASMSIPFFFRPVRLPCAGGKQQAWLVDGGMLSNFPIDVFDSLSRPRWPTFGIKLSARPDAAQGTANRVSGPISMVRAMIDTATGFYDRMHIASNDVADRTIFIDTGKISAIDFDLTDDQRDQLYASGREAAIQFLDGGGGRPPWDFDAYIAKHRTPSAPSALPAPRSATKPASAVAPRLQP